MNVQTSEMEQLINQSVITLEGQQKCMSYSKCSNSENKRLYTSDLAIKKLKFQTLISNKQNLKNKAF